MISSWPLSELLERLDRRIRRRGSSLIEKSMLTRMYSWNDEVNHHKKDE